MISVRIQPPKIPTLANSENPQMRDAPLAQEQFDPLEIHTGNSRVFVLKCTECVHWDVWIVQSVDTGIVQSVDTVALILIHLDDIPKGLATPRPFDNQ
ncbi:hypothetical protein P4O66_010648 [Electrophorus voltai]|uniref:Uncharacterized protein n=1 Tax=Electrophorus voltai TaxID=2609070 RepID=A0AAD8ZAC0_9TELE|nr:hypothetical protein P4O66_010648 [Electrophorus voltai]